MSRRPHHWGRSEKYHVRPRHLYALVFPEGFVYIGQSVDLKTREAQHRAPSGGWNREFEFLPLSTIEGTKADAEHHEVAWRTLAARKGWGVYARPPGIPIRRHGARMNRQAYAAMRTMTWPLTSHRVNWGAWLLGALTMLAIAAWLVR